METLVTKLKGAASSPYARKEKELIIPVTYDSSKQGTEYGKIILNINSNISDTSETVPMDILKVVDKNNNYQFGCDGISDTFNPDSGIYSSELTISRNFSYGYGTFSIVIYFKKNNGNDGLIDIDPLVDTLKYDFIGRQGIGNYITVDTKAKGKTPISIMTLPIANNKITNVYLSDFMCGIDDLIDMMPSLNNLIIRNMQSYNIDSFEDRNIEVIDSDRLDGDLYKLPSGIKQVNDSYDKIGITSFSGDGSAKFTQLNKILLYTSAKSLTQSEMDNFLKCLAASTWSGNNMQLYINTGAGVKLNEESLSTIRSKGVSVNK